jgi:hypothetical protein
MVVIMGGAGNGAMLNLVVAEGGGGWRSHLMVSLLSPTPKNRDMDFNMMYKFQH